MVKLIIDLSRDNIVTIQLKKGSRVLDSEDLTLSRNLDKLFINALDNLAVKNRIDRLSLKTVKIAGKIRPDAVSGMIIGAIKGGLGS